MGRGRSSARQAGKALWPPGQRPSRPLPELAGVGEPPQRRPLELGHPDGRDTESLSHLCERVSVPAVEPVAQHEDPPLTWVEALEGAGQLI